MDLPTYLPYLPISHMCIHTDIWTLPEMPKAQRSEAPPAEAGTPPGSVTSD